MMMVVVVGFQRVVVMLQLGRMRRQAERVVRRVSLSGARIQSRHHA